MTPAETAYLALRPALTALDYAGVALFALTGALAAARAKQTIVTFAFFASITGIGGGTLRDLLIGAPVFWVARPEYLWVCLGAALAVWLLPVQRFRLGLILWFDAVGLAAFAVVGAAKSLGYGNDPVVAVAMGVLTATFGGIVRDVLAREPSMILGPEIYISAAALAAAAYVALRLAGLDPFAAGAIGAGCGFAVRAAAIRWNLKLPGYRG